MIEIKGDIFELSLNLDKQSKSTDSRVTFIAFSLIQLSGGEQFQPPKHNGRRRTTAEKSKKKCLIYTEQ